MRVLVVYHSKTGTCRTVGAEIAKNLKADVDEIIPANARPLYKPDGKMDRLEMMVCALQTMINWRTKLKPAAKNPADYDLVVIGSPTWAGGVSAPVRSYLSSHKGLKKVAFFCTMGTSDRSKIASQAVKVFGQMAGLTASPIMTLAVVQKEADSEKARKTIKEFAAKTMK